MIELIGFLLAFTACVLSVVGSWYVSSADISQRQIGFGLWICSNPLNILVLSGVMLNIWNGQPLVFSLVTQFYFLYTAFRGWGSNRAPAVS
jgi:hypothetical protein